MQTNEVNPVSDLRRLLSRQPSTLLKASAPDLCAALPLLVKFFERHDQLEHRCTQLEQQVAILRNMHNV